MRNAVACANNDIITIAWSYGKRPDGCMGFALYRIDAKGKETVLPSHAVFKGETIQPGQTTAEFPIQKFYWKDPYARLAGAARRHFLSSRQPFANPVNFVVRIRQKSSGVMRPSQRQDGIAG